MAKKEPITSSPESTFTCPAIAVPENAKTDGYGTDFELGFGLHRVRFHWSRVNEVWMIEGSQDALLAHGLLRPEWMPGYPGNNLTSQIVIFKEDGPCIIRGNLRGGRRGNSWLQAYFKSRKTMRVRYAPPLEHRKKLNIAVDEARARHQAEVESYKSKTSTSYKPQSPGEFRQTFLTMVDAVAGPWLSPENAKKRGFCFNKGSADRINRAFSELRRAIAEGGIQSKPSLHRDGNVVYLGDQPTGGA